MTIVDCTANTYYMHLTLLLLWIALQILHVNPDKDAEYIKLVGVVLKLVNNDIYRFFNLSVMDLIITKSHDFDSMDNFSFSSGKHVQSL